MSFFRHFHLSLIKMRAPTGNGVDCFLLDQLVWRLSELAFFVRHASAAALFIFGSFTMERINVIEQVMKKAKDSGNLVICDPSKVFVDKTLSISFRGTGNILFLEDGAQIQDSKIEFFSDNAVIYLSKNEPRFYCVSLHVYGSTSIYIGGDCFFNKQLCLVTSERQNIFIGSGCMFSFGTTARCADPHLIYDIDTKKRINDSKSVIIGDHVWIGQNALILKGSCIGSGAIVAANSVVANKKIPSNTCAAGNPAKIIRENVFFSRECVHDWYDEKISKKYELMDTDRYVYNNSECTMDFKEIDKKIKSAAKGSKKLDLIIKYLAKNDSKYRFKI